ncbi:MAG: endopeptidase La [Bacteroidales bacterium]|nr:endopeptidase La [Bacteroidales bacterium]
MSLYLDDIYDDLDDQQISIVPILTDCDKDEDFQEGMENLSNKLPILPTRNMVLFPAVTMPISVGRTKSMRLIKELQKKKGGLIGVVCQKDMEVEDPGFSDLYRVGVVAEVIRVLELPDHTTTIIIQGKKRFILNALLEEEPYLKGDITPINDPAIPKEDTEMQALFATIKELTIRLLKSSGNPPGEILLSIKNNKNLLYMINFACTNIPVMAQEKQELLQIDDIKERAYKLLVLLNREVQLLELKQSIQSRTKEDIDRQQKEYYLQQQLKTIQQELGGTNSEQELAEMRAKAAQKKWSPAVAEAFEKELRKLERISPQMPDYSMQVGYLQTLLNLPWNEYTRDNFNLKQAERVLNRDHYGLEKVKERILEHLAVLKLKGDFKSPIICLYGPPGVGKTSLGKSVADALKRKYVRVSLGGLHDEAEIRGHRRTYIGAMPGRIIQNIQKAGSSNPVFILDEIDKIGNDYKGDPAAALLEVLDPEQNSAFHDNYLDLDYDLSKVLFIATANNINTISQPLLDRMELIEVSGYIIEEKIEIALRHLIPKQMENHGIGEKITFKKDAIRKIIESYTRESGVRELDKKIAKIMRKMAKKIAMGEEVKKSFDVADVILYLGKPEYTSDRYQGNDHAGVVTGLAWTSVGGEILFVESSISKGKGAKLTLTGNLGDVMKESAVLALEYIKAHASKLGINENLFEEWNVHIHVPEGAIPKDGPSAGITMLTSLASTFTQRKVKKGLAMTGEITLRGRVLPVGGIKEKILAAKRAGIKEIILCEENRKDIEDIKDIYIKGLTFHYVTWVDEVLKIALLEEKVAHPLF